MKKTLTFTLLLALLAVNVYAGVTRYGKAVTSPGTARVVCNLKATYVSFTATAKLNGKTREEVASTFGKSGQFKGRLAYVAPTLQQEALELVYDNNATVNSPADVTRLKKEALAQCQEELNRQLLAP